MPIKYVVIREVKSATMKSGEAYPFCLDQENVRWNLFRPLPHVEVNHAYAFYYESDGQYQNVKRIEPVVNIFKAQALKDTANRNDYKKDLFMSLSYAKDLLIAHEVPDKTAMFSLAYEIYEWINQTTDKLMPKEPEIK